MKLQSSINKELHQVRTLSVPAVWLCRVVQHVRCAEETVGSTHRDLLPFQHYLLLLLYFSPLAQELESFVHKRDKDKKELIERAEDFEQLAMKRLEKVRCIDTSSSPPHNVTAFAPTFSCSPLTILFPLFSSGISVLDPLLRSPGPSVRVRGGAEEDQGRPALCNRRATA